MFKYMLLEHCLLLYLVFFKLCKIDTENECLDEIYMYIFLSSYFFIRDVLESFLLSVLFLIGFHITF